MLSLALIAFIMLALASCAKKDSADSLLDRRLDAMRAGDAEAIGRDLAPNAAFAALQPLSEPDRWKQLFALWGKPEVLESARSLDAHGDSVEIVRSLRMKFSSGERTLLYEGPESLTVVKDPNGRWKVLRIDLPLFLIAETLEIRRFATNSHDLAMYMTTVAEDYNDAGKNKQAVEESMNHQFGFWNGISIGVKELEIRVRKDNTADAIQKFRMTVVKNDNPRSMDGTERIVFAKEKDGLWKITGGLGS